MIHSFIIFFKFNLFLYISYYVAVCVKSRSQRGEIKVIYSSTVPMMCAVLISVIFCSSIASRWPGSSWRFWSNPFLIVTNAQIITGTILVLTFHILLTSISRFLYLLSFSVSCVLRFESSGMAISISRQVFSFLSCSTILLLLWLSSSSSSLSSCLPWFPCHVTHHN
jgi:hypothetical protein